MTRWDAVSGAQGGARFAARFSELAARGVHVHGEAGFCAGLVAAGASVLDAGCGTGRVALELARRGFRCVGVDVDAEMLKQARDCDPDGNWIQQDLTALCLDMSFDLVVAAGNVIPLLATGTEAAVLHRLASHLRQPGLLVTGFGLDAAHLPLESAPFGLGAYDEWCVGAGLELVERFGTWGRARFDEPAGYAVSVHRQTSGGDDTRKAPGPCR